jgi:amino acid transporter
MDLTESRTKGAICVLITFALIKLFICIGLLKTSSRLVRGMAQDRTFPCSKWISEISTKLNAPLNAFWVSIGFQIIFAVISAAGPSAFTSLVSAAAASYQIAYITPIVVVSLPASTKDM